MHCYLLAVGRGSKSERKNPRPLRRRCALVFGGKPPRCFIQRSSPCTARWSHLPLLRIPGPSFPLSVLNSTGFISVSLYFKTLLSVPGFFTSTESLRVCPRTSQPWAHVWLKPNPHLLTAGRGPCALRAPPGVQARVA